MKLRTLNKVPFALMLTSFSGLALSANVGYYEMCDNGPSPSHVAPITNAGHTPVPIYDLTDAELASIDALFITNCSNGQYGLEYINRRAAIAARVRDYGLNLAIHDRSVLELNKFFLELPQFLLYASPVTQ